MEAVAAVVPVVLFMLYAGIVSGLLGCSHVVVRPEPDTDPPTELPIA